MTTTPALDTKSLGLVEQIIRIVMFAGGGAILGDGVAQSAEYQQLVGAVMQVAAGAWWIYRQRSVSKAK